MFPERPQAQKNIQQKHYQDKLQLYEQRGTDHRQPQQAHIEISRHQ